MAILSLPLAMMGGAEHHMARIERRSCPRFRVPEGLVDWADESDARLREWGCALRDLSRGGLRLVSTGPPARGRRLVVRIAAAGLEPIELRGVVAWTSVSSGQFHDVGVQFAPYGEEAGSNPPAALQRLAELEERFLEQDPA